MREMDEMMNNTIQYEVCSILLSITGKKIDDDSICLFGKPYYMNPRDMVYMFIIIQDRFNIKISGNDIIENQFSTVNNITRLVSRKIGK